MSTSTRALVLALACACAPALADTTLGYRISGKDCVPDISGWQFTRSMLRSDNRVMGTQSIVVYDHLEKSSHVLNPVNRTYFTSELDLDAADFAGDVLVSMGHHVQKAGGGNTTKDIAACAFLPVDLLPGEMPSCSGDDPMMTLEPFRSWDGKRERIDRDTGKATIGGVACTRREHLRDGRKLREDCTTAPTALKLPADEAKLFERMTRHNVSAAKAMFRDGAANIDATLQRILVVEQVCFDGAGRETGRATLQVDHDAIPAARFEIPDGYVEAIAPGNQPAPRRGKR